MASLLYSRVGSVCMGKTSSGSIQTLKLGQGIIGTGYRKTSVGVNASKCNSGADNTAFGADAMKNNSGSDNTVIGHKAMFGGTGIANTAIGNCSLYNLTSGRNNTAVGFQSLYHLTTGCHNVALGYKSGLSLYTGNGNTIIGSNANVGAGNDCQNVVIGYNAIASGGGTGLGHVVIGFGALGVGYYSIAIGWGVYSAGNIFWGGPQNNVYNCVYGNWTYNSDCRDKTDITELNDNLGINLIRKLKPVSYRYDNRKLYVNKCGFEYGQKDGSLKVDGKSYGFLAQEIENVANELNIQYDAVKYDSKKDSYGFAYNQLIASVVKTIKTIDERIQVLKTKI